MEVNSDSHLCSEVCVRGDYFLKTGLLFDCKFLVGAEPHQEVISGHKLILAMASPVFETMFCGSIPENSDTTSVVDILPETFRQLLEYIYKGTLKANTVEEIYNLCYAAKKYMLDHAVTKCVDYLRHQVTTENVLQLYSMARMLDAECLMEECENIIKCNTKEVLNSSTFKDIDLNMAVDIFSLNSLTIDSEVDLIEAAARYAKERNFLPPADMLFTTNNNSDQALDNESFTKRANTDTSTYSDNIKENNPAPVVDTQKEDDQLSVTSTSSEHATSNISQIRRLAEKIRFLTLTPQQFAECSARLSIMTASEEYAILINLVTTKSTVPMPEGFTTSTELRVAPQFRCLD